MKFFTKLRQQFLSKNKFSMYLLYALGEIILVVIGILIALSINNRNDERKFNNQVIEHLKLFSNEIADDIGAFEYRIEYYPIYIDYFEKLLAGDFDELDLNRFVETVTGSDYKVIFGNSFSILVNNGGINSIKDKELVQFLGWYSHTARQEFNQELTTLNSPSSAYMEENILSLMQYDSNNKLIGVNIIKAMKEKKIKNIINLQLSRYKYLLQILREVSNNAKEAKKRLDNYIIS